MNTNKIKQISMLAIFLALFACQLNEDPTDTATKEPVFGSEKGLQLYANSFYLALPDGETVFQADNMSDIVARTGVEAFLQPGAYGPRQSSGWSWTQLRNINYFIENCTDERVSLEAREHYIGMARLFRAIFYFEKVKRFGDVPWVDQVLDFNDATVFGKRDPRSLVMTKVLEDLDFACTKIRKASDNTRSLITRNVALGYKSRICLFEGTYRKYHTELGLTETAKAWLDQSVSASQAIINTGEYSIFNPNNLSYRDLFISKKPIASEVLFAFLCDPALKVTTAANRRFISPTYGVRPSLSRRFVNTYLNTDGSRFTDDANHLKKSFKEELNGRDIRLMQTIRYPEYTRTKSGVPVKVVPDFGITFTGYQPIKFCFDEMLPYDNESLNDNAIPYMRYAEILLNLAEAKAELGTLSNTDWTNTIGELRKRGGLTGDALVMPTKIDPYLQAEYFPNLSNPVLLEIRRERAIELIFEGFRFDDLMRWKTGELMEKEYYGIYVSGVNTPIDLDQDGKADVRFYTGDKPASVAGVVDINVNQGQQFSLSDITHGTLIFNPGVRQWLAYKYLYPIPQSEINLNPNLLINGQNNGWPN